MSKQIKARLDCDLDVFRSDLRNLSELVVRLYERLDETRITPGKTRREIASLFDEPLPEEPQSMESILSQVETKIFDTNSITTMKCAPASVIEAHGIKVVHMGSKKMLYPPSTHDFEACPTPILLNSERSPAAPFPK